MKIGIMTFPNMTSYGCSMQMYGLYRAVELAGGSAEIINYQNNYKSFILRLLTDVSI